MSIPRNLDLNSHFLHTSVFNRLCNVIWMLGTLVRLGLLGCHWLSTVKVKCREFHSEVLMDFKWFSALLACKWWPHKSAGCALAANVCNKDIACLFLIFTPIHCIIFIASQVDFPILYATLLFVCKYVYLCICSVCGRHILLPFWWLL